MTTQVGLLACERTHFGRVPLDVVGQRGEHVAGHPEQRRLPDPCEIVLRPGHQLCLPVSPDGGPFLYLGKSHAEDVTPLPAQLRQRSRSPRQTPLRRLTLVSPQRGMDRRLRMDGRGRCGCSAGCVGRPRPDRRRSAQRARLGSPHLDHRRRPPARADRLHPGHGWDSDR